MTKPIDLAQCADHFDFLAKMLRSARTVRRVGKGGLEKPTATWKAAAEEAELASEKIRAQLSGE